MSASRLGLLALVVALALPATVLPATALAQDEFHGETADTEEVGPVDVELERDAHGDPVHGADVHVETHAGDAHAGDAHAGEHDAHGGEHHAEIDTFELGGSIVNFALLLVILFLLLRKSLPEFLRNRRASVVEGMEEAKRVKEEAEAKYKEYSARIDNLDAELDRLREEMRRAGMDERDRIVADASKRAEKMRDEARFLIEQQMKQLREDLTREAIEAAIGAAEAMLVKATTPQDQERLAKEYLGSIRTSLSEKVQEKRL